MPRERTGERTIMKLPALMLENLPSLADAPGIVGSLSDMATAGPDDRLLYLLVLIYESYPPGAAGS